MVWIAGHELFHFLRHTRQVEGIQRETRANRWGFKWLREFKAEREVLAA
jgi:Zn-dependent peptidase ImmA (M78 family)